MSRTTDSLETVIKRWNALKAQRPNENFADLSAVTYDLVGDMFAQWKLATDALESKGAWQTAPDLVVADPQLSSDLDSLASLISQGSQNGTAWLVGSGLMKQISDIQLRISTITSRRIAVTREIARELLKVGQSEIERVLAAEKATKSILAARDATANNANFVSASAEKTKEIEQQVTTRLEEISRIESEAKKTEADVTSSAEAAKEAWIKIEAIHKQIAQLRQSADEREAKLEERVSLLNKQVAETDQEAKNALESVRVALRAARDQGLAKSFQLRSDILREERRLWTLVFIGALVILVAVSVTFVIELERFTYEQLLVAFLRKIALAGPCIWLGWYAARQVGRVAKVQEDYEYKAASALAFQSYKEEAAVGADPELTKQLLKHAIDTFGENPVRLYEAANVEAVTPMESIFKSMPKEKLVDLLASALTAKIKAV